MALKIRLSRAGSKKRPVYRVVVADSRSPRDGRFIEKVGLYNPLLQKDNKDRIQLNLDSIKEWISKGAKPTDKVARFLGEAGVIPMPAQGNNPKKAQPKKKAQEIIDTNVMGTFLFSREAAKLMKKNKYGRIVNITTVGTQMKLEGEAIYTASKSAVENLTVVMSRELANYGITVNALGPTPAMTDLIRFVPENKIQNIVDDLAFDRLTEINDITNVLDFFISEKSDFITGQLIFLGGG